MMGRAHAAKRETRAEVKVISLDFAGTIVTHEFLEDFWRRAIPGAYASQRGVSLERAIGLVQKEYDTVSMDDINWYLPTYWLRRFGLRKNTAELVEDSLEALHFYPDALDFMGKAQRKYSLIVTSGVPSCLMTRPLQMAGVRIHRVYSSSDMGIVGKPPDFYEFVLKDLDLIPSQIVHLGDDRTNDEVNPRSVGIKGYFVDRARGATLGSVEGLLVGGE